LGAGYWAGVLLAILAMSVVNRIIRASLAAPRVRETSVPDGLLWHTAQIPTVSGKTLFGWFMPAGEGAPVLAVIHGGGGNAEMMLPLARPLHAAGYVLLLFDARSHGRSDGDSLASLPRFAEDLTRRLYHQNGPGRGPVPRFTHQCAPDQSPRDTPQDQQ
jgi:pimeloyl-ACP methyl ester carboxylesterase